MHNLMKYENKKTGAIIEIASVLSGGDWVCLTKQNQSKKTSKAKTTSNQKEK